MFLNSIFFNYIVIILENYHIAIMFKYDYIVIIFEHYYIVILVLL